MNFALVEIFCFIPVGGAAAYIGRLSFTETSQHASTAADKYAPAATAPAAGGCSANTHNSEQQHKQQQHEHGVSKRGRVAAGELDKIVPRSEWWVTVTVHRCGR